MKCPKCGLINDENTVHCDCGYNFASGALDRGFIRRRRRIQAWWPTKVLLVAAIFIVAEVAIWIAFKQVLVPGGLLLLIILGYLFGWEDIRS